MNNLNDNSVDLNDDKNDSNDSNDGNDVIHESKEEEDSRVRLHFDDISLNENVINESDVTIICDQLSDDNSGQIERYESFDSSEDSKSMASGEEMTDNSHTRDILELLDKKNGDNGENGSLFDSPLFERMYENKIIDLQTERNELQNGIEELKCKMNESETAFNEQKARLGANIDKLSKQNESTRKDLESMVIKYATSEKEVICLKKAKEDVDKKLRDAIKDKESLTVRIKGLSNEKQQLMSSLDRKIIEISSVQKKYDDLKDQLKDRDLKWKQTQTKLREAENVRQDLQLKLDSELERVGQLCNEVEKLRSECHELSNDKSTKDDDSANSGSNSNQVSDNTLIEQLQQEVLNYKSKASTVFDENNCLTFKIQTLERERLDHEHVMSNLKQCVNELQIEIAGYVSKVRDIEQLKLQLENEKELVSVAVKESERLKVANNELRSEMESCRHKEGELLEFTERLTAKSVHLQSEHNILEQKSALLKEEVEKLQKQCNDMSKDNSGLNTTIAHLKELHQKEMTLMVKKLAEKTKLSDDLKTKVDELENDIRVNKRRHVTSIKELNKELFAMKKRIEHYEGQSTSNQSDSVSIGSRTSSSNSLTDTNSANTTTSHNSQSANHSQISQQKIVTSQSYQTETNSNSNCIPEVDKQALIDRILRLQKSLTKRNEKIDFLEEHNQHLTDEVKKKSKLIQYYILREETGALATSKMDDHKKDKSKRQFAKRGGTIMSSLYNTNQNDSLMTLDLSLEINNKLQAVLEDTILKNITLKENINTLGDEIARLTKHT